MAIDLKITDAGYSAAIAANTAGASVTITQIGVGTARYIPASNATALQAEVGRVSITKSTQINSTTRQLDYRFPGSSLALGLNVSPIGELALFLSDGTMFAVWSDPAAIASSKAPDTELRGSVFLRLSSLPTGSVTIQAVDPATGVTPQFGGFGGEGDLTITGSLTLSGRKRLNNFYLRSGATLTVDKFLILECSGEAVFEPGSTTNVQVATPGGAASSTSGTPAVVLPVGLVPGQNFGSTGGYAQTAKKYSADLSPVGSGGQTGAILKSDSTNSIACSTGTAGNGGGSIEVQARVGIRFGGTINANGGDALASVLSPNNIGSAVVSGSGGGSAGRVCGKTPGYWTIDGSSVINAIGGNGADGIRTSTTVSTTGAAPGSGGGGGLVELYGPNLPTTIPGTVSVLGGLSGNYNAGNINTATGSYTSGGTGGAFGNDATTAFGGTAQARQASGRIIALPILVN